MGPRPTPTFPRSSRTRRGGDKPPAHRPEPPSDPVPAGGWGLLPQPQCPKQQRRGRDAAETAADARLIPGGPGMTREGEGTTGPRRGRAREWRRAGRSWQALGPQGASSSQPEGEPSRRRPNTPRHAEHVPRGAGLAEHWGKAADFEGSEGLVEGEARTRGRVT